MWDLNYHFAQEPPDKGASAQFPNEGSKTFLITGPKAGGIVQPKIVPPVIESLRITGEFALEKQLKADYNFISNGDDNAEDRSLFWWGGEGTTASLANTNINSGSLDSLSEVLTESHLGQVLEVSVLPIKLESNQLIRGQVVTVTTRDENNDIQYAPTLSELSIVSRFTEAEGIVVNDLIYGQYKMQFGTDQEDISLYEWRSALTNDIIQAGPTLPARANAGSQGLTSPLILTSDLVGDHLVLTIFPLDGKELKGQPRSVSTTNIQPLPRVDNLTIIYDTTETNEPPPLGLEVNQVIRGTYEFTSYTQAEDRSLYNWEVGDDELIQNGTAQNGTIPAIQIQPEYVGKSIRLIINAVDSVNRIGNLENVSTDIVKQLQPEVSDLRIIYLDDNDVFLVDHAIKGQYRFIPVDSSTDNSSYAWQIKATGAILESGETTSENGLGQTPEFIAPLSAAGEVLTLIIYPKDSSGRDGQPQTADSLIVDYLYPIITDIGLIYPRNMPDGLISVGQRLGGFYSINEGENPFDKSEYEWKVIGSGVVLGKGQTTKPPADPLGYISPVVVPAHALGDVIQLTVVPIDTKGIRGRERTVQTGEIQYLFPYIDQLAFINGNQDNFEEVEYRVGQSLAATYRFHSSINSPDNSIYEWSLVNQNEVLKTGDTTRFPTGQGLVTEFIIPIEAIGDILRLTVFPFDGNGLDGPENEIDTTEILYQIPEISNLRVDYISFDNLNPPGENSVFRASYQFIGIEGTTDMSTYRWMIYSTDETLRETIVEGASVVDESRGLSFIPDLPMEPRFSGKVLELKILPIDSNGKNGIEYSHIIGSTDYIAPQVKDVFGQIMDANSQFPTLAGRYEFIPGTNALDNSTFQWVLSSTDEVLLEGQTVRLNGLRIAAIPGLNIRRSMIGDTVILRVTPVDGLGESGTTRTHPIFIDSGP
ncbi:hypothetical protein [Thorsellia anophelis]|uniref:Uncharacterized protein n=1 Tax=Thorsellia anophelis DSM 18579 TaxID=1123402 RepID=A0A1I0CZ75_9GAMM|nr:hypothetical protein [Thorsellia anophelis]SET25082.1 hypothetical protein SAMN02583745_01787 [Thorsellia anophelis DSM 18579]